MGRNPNKKIWSYYDRISERLARCKLCQMHQSLRPTSNMVRHLYHRHNVDVSYYGAEKTAFLKYKAKKKTVDREASRNGGTHELDTKNNLINSIAPTVVHEKEENTADLVGNIKIENDTQATLETNEASSEVDEDLLHPLAEFQTILPTIPTSNLLASGEREAVTNTGDDVRLKESCQIDKLKAETRYYNELADLAHAKRIMIELQSEKLRLEIGRMVSS